MSQGKPMPLDLARRVADELVEQLRPGCERIEVAGSIRRQKPTVADVEIVAMPRVEEIAGGDLWGTPVNVDRLEELVSAMRLAGSLDLRDVEIHRRDGSVEEGHRDGAAYKALVYRDLPVDLFVVHEPDQWGLIFALRTGPGEWNTRLVTDCKRFLRRVEGGYLYRSGARVACREERDFFRAIGQPWVEPRDRHAGRVSIQATLR